MGTKNEDKKKYEIPTYVFNHYRINLWTGDYLNKRKRYSTAIKQYNAAEINANLLDRDMVPIYEGRSKAYLHTWNLKVTERNVMEGLQLRPNNAQIMLTLGNLFYQKNQFEDSLGAHYRGHLNKPRSPNFIHGIWASTGTIMNSLGPKVGNIMSKKRLGGVVVKLKEKELGLVPCLKGHNEFSKMRKIEKVKRIKDAYDQIYLKRVAKNKFILQSCLNGGKLFSANKKQNLLLQVSLQDALDKLNAAEMALWVREPLYTREQDILSRRLTLFRSKKQDLKKADLKIVVNLRIAALDQAFNQNKYAECYRLGDQLRSFLFKQSEKDLPSKKEAIATVIGVLGDMFLKNKTFVDGGADVNDERLMIIFGFQKPYKLIHKHYIDEVYHPRILRLKAFLDDKLADLDKTTDSLEKAYLCHEIGVAYSFKNMPNETKKYAREAIFASKATKDRKWLLNSMFLLARSEIQQGNMDQGRVSLNGLILAAEKFGYTNFKYLAFRAYKLTTIKNIKSKKTDLEVFEKKIINAMCTKEYAITAMKYIKKARILPVDKRFTASREAETS